MLVLIGASATGKSAICNELIKSYVKPTKPKIIFEVED